MPAELSHYDSWLDKLRGPNCWPEHKIAVDKNWKPCGWEDSDAYMKAVLDLKYIISPKEVAVYDWKSGKIYDDHDDQKRLYAPMVFAEHPDLYTVRSIHVYLDLGQNREKIFHRTEMAQLMDHWNQRAAAVERDTEFIPSPGYHCKWCGYSRAQGGPCRF